MVFDNKEYYRQNADKIREKRRKHYHENKEALLLWKKENPDNGRRSQYKCRYGITIEDYNRMFLAQGGCCALCGKPQIETKKNLDIDHCHVTNKVRGLLCWNCNIGLGKFKDNVEVLKKAVAYLEDNT